MTNRDGDRTLWEAIDEDVVRIEEDEWHDVARRLRFSLFEDERAGLGNLGLVIGGGRRRWFSSDTFRLVVLDAGPDEGDATLAVSPRLVEAWPLVADGTGAATLRVRREVPGSTIRLEGPGGVVTLDHHDRELPELDELLSASLERPGVTVTLDAEVLLETLRLVRIAPAGPFLDEDREIPLMWLQATPDRLDVTVDWDELGPIVHSLPVTASGNAAVPASPALLHELVMALEPGPVMFTIPEDPTDALRVQQGAVTALLQPVDPMRPTVEHVEGVLAAVFGDDVVHTDPAGNYPLSAHGVPVHARLLAGAPIRLSVFAQVLDDVELDPELLVELNQLNTSTGMAKVLWSDRCVLVVGELVADTLDPEEVVAVHQRVAAVADGLGPALAARFGGRSPLPASATRWEDARCATLRAELVAGEWHDLNGPDAVDVLPSAGPVYVVGAHDPHGRVRSADANHRDTARLAAELFELGAGSVRATRTTGPGTETDRVERCFLVWDIDRDTAVLLGAEHGQDTIFELTADDCRVVGVADGRLDTRPRSGGCHTTLR